MRALAVLLLAVTMDLCAEGPGVIRSRFSKADFAVTADPDSDQWHNVPGVFFENGPRGEPVPGHRTEVRSRWTGRNLYFLFLCPYETLHLKPKPMIDKETNQLWNWDVAEVFIGSDFDHIRRYKEFEVSPQGEWVDLDIDRDHPLPEGGWLWNSGFEAKARIDAAHKVWYAEMRIPMDKIDTRPPAPGLQMRVNLYRCQGADPNRKYIAWQPTHSRSFHVPEAFGRLQLTPE